jgi:hypothetical protein
VLPKELLDCHEMRRALNTVVSEKRSSMLGAGRRAGDALLEELAKSDRPLRLSDSFFADKPTVGGCVRGVLQLPPSVADAHGDRARLGTIPHTWAHVA